MGFATYRLGNLRHSFNSISNESNLQYYLIKPRERVYTLLVFLNILNLFSAPTPQIDARFEVQMGVINSDRGPGLPRRPYFFAGDGLRAVLRSGQQLPAHSHIPTAEARNCRIPTSRRILLVAFVDGGCSSQSADDYYR
jgi:hypothetical protein